MSTPFATTAAFHDLRTWAIRYGAAGLAVAGISIALSVPTVVGDAGATRPAPARVNTSSWGPGPTMITLLDSARHERPLHGGEPAAFAGFGARPASAPVVVEALCGFNPTPAACAPHAGL
jgi:hypothetical protein